MNFRSPSLFLVACLATIQCSSSSTSANDAAAAGKNHSLCIAFYNVENLFDAHDDPGVEDEEFTPAGEARWTEEKYEQKIANIARVIRALNDGNGPDIIGLSEVENRGVLETLIANPQLRRLHYGIVHHDSPDHRGIDVALLYKKSAFKVIGQKNLPVDISAYGDKPTRDVMMVTGVAGKNDTITFFLNHWPSRRGGKESSEPKRMEAATVVKHAVDSLQHLNPNTKILIMGDLNDNPTDKSISDILRVTATPDTASPTSLYDCDFNFNWRQGQGSEYYRGSWSRFIQIIVSTSVIKNQLNGDGTFTNVHLFKPDWMLTNDPYTHDVVPRRTSERDLPGMGFSDHLPVYINLVL